MRIALTGDNRGITAYSGFKLEAYEEEGRNLLIDTSNNITPFSLGQENFKIDWNGTTHIRNLKLHRELYDDIGIFFVTNDGESF
jgi:adenine specific DNA methylase Mod